MDNKIAVIGMACRFPGARNMAEYWDNLINGKDAIRHFTNDEISDFEFDFNNLKDNPDYVRARGVLDDIDEFDASFFGMTPTEAAGTDPQHRIWLETVWDAFENAGCDPVNYKGAIGVFAGGYISTYLLNNILRDPRRLENYIRLRNPESYQILTANDPSFISTKTAYKFNLKGPAINVQTACSTSLVAIAQACQCLYSYESDICLAGGVCVSVPQESGYLYQEGAIPSPDGVCRPFDSQAKGTVPGNGVGVVVLKRLEEALRDGDNIYAVVRGWALNNDGSNKVSYTAPSIDGQAEAIMMAQSFADVSPEDVGYIEAHGTATQLGDPVEVMALTKAFSRKTSKKQFCGLGSVKSNIGHTDAAAGVASFIKASLSAFHKTIPASLHFVEPNKNIDFVNTPFYVQKEIRQWTDTKPLIIGVSSFGIGGTNAHVIIEEPPLRELSADNDRERNELILLSARSEYSLNKRKKELLKFAETHGNINLRDVAFTLLSGRNHMPYRSYMVASEKGKAILREESFVDGKANELISKTAFMFPGQGAQYVSMGKSLYHSNEKFREILDECFKIVKSETGNDLRSILFASTEVEEAEKRLARTAITQPALFIIEYAVSQVLIQLGVRPTFMIGHSIGEYTAACIAGVFDMATALKIVIKRGQLMESMPGGKMFAVRAGIEQLQGIENAPFEIGADNASDMCSISFKNDLTDKVISLLDENGIQYIPLNTSHAFHSCDFDPVLKEFGEYVDSFSLKTPKLPFISCLTGEFIRSEMAVSGSYWAEQLRNTVQFRKGVERIAENGDTILIEVGPNTHLSSLVRQNRKLKFKPVVVSSLGKSDNVEEQEKMMAVLGNLFINGIALNEENLFRDKKPLKISLPTYPYDKKRHWIDFRLSSLPESQTETESRTGLLSGAGVLSESILPVAAESLSDNTVRGKILGIWKSVLGIDLIDFDTDFFELGGHSLLALQIITRIKEELNQRISLKDFLDNPTINSLSILFEEKEVSCDTKAVNAPAIDLLHLPLSDSQKRIWIISQLDKHNPAYNISFTYKISGDFNREVFQKSVDMLFERHFLMHSVFMQRGGEPYCEVILKKIIIDEVDFSHLPEAEREQKICSFAGADSRQPFNVEYGPLYRLYLLKRDENTFFFHASVHHLIFDGWSWSVFITDLRKIYKGLLNNKKIETEEVENHYFEYFRSILDEESVKQDDRSTKFWIDNLKDSSPELNFPYDYKRQDVSSGFGEKERIEISTAVTHRLRELSRKENTTLFATLLSALGVLFNKYTGDTDICIGTHVANRTGSKLEDIFGMFVNTVPVRLNVDDEVLFSDFILYTRNALLNSISHQDLSFEKIVEAVNPTRISNTNPLFQVSIVWLNNSAIDLELEGTKIERVFIRKGVSPFDITVYLWERGDTIEGEIEYNVDILTPETVVRFKNSFVHLLQSISDNPDTAISALSILSENEKQALDEFNKTEVPLKETLIQRLFEEKAASVPFSTALISGDSHLSYKELDDRANQIARYLISCGVNEGDVVGVCVKRSVEMVVSVLGVLKAGCAYLPMDPSFPDDRIKFMFEDSGARALISHTPLNDKLIHFSETRIVLVDSDNDKIASFSKTPPALKTDGQSLAYLIYTSGSTGTPKGVKVHHQAVVNFLNSMMKRPGITDKDVLLGLTTLSFDISVLELFLPLSSGAVLVIANEDDITDGQKLSTLLIKNNITIMQATPATWNLLLGSGWNGKADMKALCGGEAIAPSLVKMMLPKVESLWNMYGPTETTVWSTCRKLTEATPPILVGTPIDNTKIFIVDKGNNLLPAGIIGEVCIGGLGVSKGYHNKPVLTKEKFVKFENNQLVYKTGDLGRILSDGNIELFGRADNQIKLRGFRIEPGEIESLLARLINVREAVVKIHRFDDNDERLVAFLNVEKGFGFNDSEIISYLSKSLPSYMIPTFIQPSDGFPRLPNGKINKKALTLDVNFKTGREVQDHEVLSETQRILISIWESILKIKNINPSESFFYAGGNSLLAISLINKVKEQLGVVLSYKDIISHPSVTLLSKLIDSHYVRTDEQINLVHLTRTNSLPLTANQKRLWLISKLHPDIPYYIIPVTYKLSGHLDFGLFKKSIDILFNRHSVFFSVIEEKGGEPYCNIIPREVKIEVLDYSLHEENIKAEEIIDFIDQESVKLFDLEKGPLFRLYIVKTGMDEFLFHLSVHHIIFDGWSNKVLINDLNKTYNGLLNNEQYHPGNLEFQLYDFAYWESLSGQMPNEEKAIDFWTNYLHNIKPVLNFPWDNVRKAIPSGKGGREQIQIPKDLTQKLKHLSESENSSLFGTMLGTYAILLHKYSGEQDICIGVPVAYRPHSKLEEIIGMMVNTIVIRAIIETKRTFRKTIRKINESLTNALNYHQLPFEKIVDIIKPERSSNINPVFQVVFAWQDNLASPIKFEGIHSTRAVGRNGASVFDLSLYMWENGDIIEGELEYNSEIIKRETAQGLRDNFLILIENLVIHDNIPVDSVSMISEREERRLDSFNDTFTQFPREKSVVQLFEEIACQYPEKNALSYKGKYFTYARINEMSGLLAQTLLEAGVTNNTPVAILCDKSPEMVIGILGILKSGGCYVPIDPEYPLQRISFILQDAGCNVLLTQEKYSDIKADGVEVINLNSGNNYHQNEPALVSSPGNSSDVAYIMYTSGTTGIPKGSMILHRSIIRLVRNTNYIKITPDDNILLTGAIVFDATTFEIWGALLNGATLNLADKEIILNPRLLGEELFKNNITILWLTSPLFTQIAEVRTDIFGKLKYLLVGGDVLSAHHINKVRKDNPHLKVINGYGPTENTTFSTTFLIEKDYESNIPIGKPISNSTAYIFDKNMNYQPVGVIGELYVGGEGLSKGYVNRDDLNAKSFIENPHKPGERLYRTGDFAKWLPDGNIEFHGRVDNQLKIRGYRVETEEVESIISEINGVVESVVKAVKIDEGDVRLVAFINVSANSDLNENELELMIKGKLPKYMVPYAIKIMHDFPKTINGKTDRNALLFNIDELRNKEIANFTSFNETEQTIYNIWSDTLKIKNISVDDNFFSLGGNSLTAISVMSRIESTFNCDLGLKMFFDSPRIRDIAEFIDITKRQTLKNMDANMTKKENVKIVKGEI